MSGSFTKKQEPASKRKEAFFSRGDQKEGIKKKAFFSADKRGEGAGYSLIQRQSDVADADVLSKEEAAKAIQYNQFMLPPAQLKLLQKGLGIGDTGKSDKETALAVAAYQGKNGLKVDGMAGPDTYAVIQADGGIGDKDDLVLFSVEVDGGMSVALGAGGLADMLGRIRVEIHLPPGNCDEYEYRQFICGDVEFMPVGAVDPMGLNDVFTSQPGGALPHIPNFHEDGNTDLHVIPGHRKMGATAENTYLGATGHEDQAHGCKFTMLDRPGIRDRVTNHGETYDFDLRFLGIVKHKTRGKIAERWWNIQATFAV